MKLRRLILILNPLLLAGGKISLIAHSAGGWLARVYMAEFEASDISLLLTLGTPHLYGFF
jgi:triacylglycerol esterase/lipase EstA (alpha/beta hydrolase family)